MIAGRPRRGQKQLARQNLNLTLKRIQRNQPARATTALKIERQTFRDHGKLGSQPEAQSATLGVAANIEQLKATSCSSTIQRGRHGGEWTIKARWCQRDRRDGGGLAGTATPRAVPAMYLHGWTQPPLPKTATAHLTPQNLMIEGDNLYAQLRGAKYTGVAATRPAATVPKWRCHGLAAHDGSRTIWNDRT